MEEIWKNVTEEEFANLYQVSNLGRVKSVRTNLILKVKYAGSGKYEQVTLCNSKKHYYAYVHRLVAETFVPNPDNLPEVCHIDENKYNNRADNLIWGTHQDNCNYPLYKMRQSEAQKGIQAKEKNAMWGKHRTEEEKEAIRKANSKRVKCENKVFASLKECACYYNVNYTTMKSYMKYDGKAMPKLWKIRGLKYIDE